VICILLQLYYWIIFARVILSWIPRLPEGIRPIADIVFAVTEPVIRLVRPLIPPLRVGAVALDLSIMLVFVVLFMLQQVFC
jgi:YggT family protein